ncbi:hypothetical protein DICPUDRAFT_77168 [Dictyostelium purpureum]|uniref:Protein kinase domain-containing protein n=1 Tax=Dictyostelium purpureum TaxID=5786 RepID=F0ZFT5_DICPU|nr:uncharacterized protein DICPUDRAFT_77168 [Dictyostelium purpureum]EGC37230.1 hypothetical protein DICPUDRAFT_77168 [Dictyostelium purpureum]|eukprot:XP_003286281.1 hypothetical protein DICPUDRAFT_77168 [Dictyostelium purpureum]
MIYKFFIFFIYLLNNINYSRGDSSDGFRSIIEIQQGGFYNVTKVNVFSEYSNVKPTIDLPLHYSYYSNICDGSDVKHSITSGQITSSAFGLGGYSLGEILYIEEGHSLFTDQLDALGNLVDIICIKGSFKIMSNFINVGYIVLPGGELIVDGDYSITFVKLHNTNITDPYNYFPGILNLGGSFLYNGNMLKYRATIIGTKKLQFDQDLTGIQITTKLGILGPKKPYSIAQFPTYDQISRTISFLIDMFSEDLIGELVIVFRTNSVISTQETDVSVFMAGQSKVSIKNVFFNFHGRTTNYAYDDTTLEISPNDPSIATAVNMGANQRFRGVLNFQFSENVVIDNCVFSIMDDGRAPIIAFASSLNISNSIIASKSGSNIIAQYGTELIYSENNYYFLESADSSPLQTPSESNMDYGYEGNAIYSLSPNISSTNDVFFGHNNVFNFNFISNRSTITGLDKDCYLPCTSPSSAVSNLVQYPIEFKINNPTIIQNDNTADISSSLLSTKQYLIKINNNGNLPSRTFSIKDLQISTPTSIFVNLPDSTLLLNNINSLNDFSIDGIITKLQIINSNIYSSKNNNVTISSTSIQNTSIKGKLKEINLPINQNYGSISTPYFYSSIEMLNNITIKSISPSIPQQMNTNTTLNIIVEFETLLNVNTLQCAYGTSIGGDISDTFGPYTYLTESKCQFEFKPTAEGAYNLVVILKTENDNDYYIIILPIINVFTKYGFKSGLFFNEAELNLEIEGNTFISGCIKPNCTINENNLKYSTLPNTIGNSPFQDIVKYGVTTNDESKPLEIQIPLNSTGTDYQIQLYFVYYQAIDDYGSPLSIYINDKPIIILETIYEESTFKNITFYYDNTQKSSNANLRIENRGDIYLTSIVTYSNLEPPIITDPPVSPTPSITPPIIPVKEDTLLLVKSIVPSVGTFIIVSIILFLLFKKFKWSIRAFFGSVYYKYLGGDGTQALFDPTDYDKYQAHSEVLAYLHGSKFCIPTEDTFPLLLSTSRLDFGLNGKLSSPDTILHDRLILTNKISSKLKYLLILPPYNNGIVCSSSKLYGSIEPGESVEIIITLTLFCTALFFEKIALFVEGHGHTFICINVQSSLSEQLDIQEFEFGSILGEGSSSVVYKCKWRNEITAVKLVNNRYSKSLSREIDLLRKIKHQNIVSFLGTVTNFKYLCIVTEYAKYGSLHSILHKTAIKLSVIQKLNIAIDIARGCSFLHQSKIIHRDLKPANILLFNIEDSGICAKISDFGSSREISSDDATMTNHIGTTVYMSNQVLEKKKYNYLTDIYSYGILLYELMTEVIPYSEMNISWSLPRFVISGGRPSKGLENVNEEIIQIIVSCWSGEENERLQFNDIISKLENLYNGLLEKRSGNQKEKNKAETDEKNCIKTKANLQIQNQMVKNRIIEEKIVNEQSFKYSISETSSDKDSVEMKDLSSAPLPIEIKVEQPTAEGSSRNSIEMKEIRTSSSLERKIENKLEKQLNDVEYLFKIRKAGGRTLESLDDGFNLFMDLDEQEKIKKLNEQYILQIQQKEQEVEKESQEKGSQEKESQEKESQEKEPQEKQPQEEQSQEKQQEIKILEERMAKEREKKRDTIKNVVFVSNTQLKDGEIKGLNENTSFRFERTPAKEENSSETKSYLTLFDYLVSLPKLDIFGSLIKRVKTKFSNNQNQKVNCHKEENDLRGGENQEIFSVDYVIDPKIGHLLEQLAASKKINLPILEDLSLTNSNYTKNDNIQIGYIPNKDPITILPGIKSFQSYKSKNSNSADFKNKLKPISFVPNSPPETHPPFFAIPTRRKYDEYLKNQLYHFITKNKTTDCNIEIS